MVYVNIKIQDHTGDRKLRLSWDNGNSRAAKKAQRRMEKMFKDLQKQGYRFYSCKKVLGIIPVKGKEVKDYNPEEGQLIYEMGEVKQKKKTERKLKKREPKIHEIDYENNKSKLEEPKGFEPEKDKVDMNRDYVATKPMRAG